MKKFTKELIANRFGIVLATLNVCYFVSKSFVNFAFSHGEGSECLFVKHYAFQWMRFQCSELMLWINLPAVLASVLQARLTQKVLPDFCSFEQAKFQIAFLLIFITLQWLFIGQTAKTIARAVRPDRS